MLNLIREIAGHERHHRAGVNVAAAQHLTQIPLPLGLALQLALGEHFSGWTSSPSRSCASLVSYRMKRGASAAHPCPMQAGPANPALLFKDSWQ
jgi:hypothetical protein